ncbi:MAG TPA: serine/threonine-protein kinase [Acidimicrobiia bacterium]|nr:serine/threonine-protein kinase [Acidimicrobiia bacterium]
MAVGYGWIGEFGPPGEIHTRPRRVIGIVQVVDDRYEILGVIASGGMATVYRAVDLRLDRPVALKRPHPGPPDNDVDVRMEREARAAAGLNHPNVVTVYDYGRDEVGPFLVMELVDGPTLQEKAPDVSAGEAFQIGAQLADGLAAIHAAGVVHRDVKPSNVIMSERGPMLTDFGIAHFDGSDEQITDPGTVLATPSYAAPEVLSGNPPTPASDVYSLALVVEQLAAGAKGVDPGVESVLERSLSDSPEDRPDAATLAAALRDGVPTVAMAQIPPSAGPETPEPTLILAIDQPTPDRRGTKSTPHETRSGWLIGVVVAALVLGSIWTLLAVADRDSGESTASVTDSTLLTPTSTLVTTTTSPPATTTPVEEDPTIETIAALEAILLEPPRSDYKEAEAREIIGRIEDRVASARAGDTEGAEEDLNALAADFGQKLDSQQSSDAIALLEIIATSIGVEITQDFEDEDD